jgi:dolichol-phosphate mannosyltransferase
VKTVVIIPTYNERENIALLLDKINSLGLENLEIVVVDDDSPDRTWEIVEDRMREDANLHLLRRMENRGRGLAGIAGFKHALQIGADCVIEMDGDFSHDPSYIPEFVRAIEKADVVLGSRFVIGGGSMGRSSWRILVSKLAASYIRLMLGFNVNDPTSGFRCFKRRVLEEIDLSSLRAKGPFVVTEILFRCHRKGFGIVEIPIVFRERVRGSSKLGFGVLLKNLFGVAGLRFSKRR